MPRGCSGGSHRSGCGHGRGDIRAGSLSIPWSKIRRPQPPQYDEGVMDQLQANIAKRQTEDAARYPQGTLYDPAMGSVQGGQVSFNPNGVNHQTYYGDGVHVSWNVNPDGSVSGVHPTDQNAAKNDPGRHF